MPKKTPPLLEAFLIIQFFSRRKTDIIFSTEQILFFIGGPYSPGI